MKIFSDILLFILAAAVLYGMYLSSDYARSNDIEEYDVIAGTLHDKGERKYDRSEKAFYVKIRNANGDYTLVLPKSRADCDFLRKVRFSENTEARVLRTFKGIHLIELKIDGRYVLRQSSN
ncbi:hypothetical protein [Pseudoalteromonas sp. T1lg88]|uniref:hypothetical protein n=1 Tax=Pseudoalteromonas sp. T1lg88 TaxID=2077104 RepID=UPI000CF5EF85|nr:hypothetical protein [Pseudoalteromonas sp. T1lg88]